MAADLVTEPEAEPTPPQASGRRRARSPRSILAWPAWLFFIVFFVAPVGFIIVISFAYKPNPFSTYELSNWSLDNYRTAFDPAYAATLYNTLRVAIVGTTICLLVALPFSYWLAVRVNPRWRGLLLGLVLVPFWTNFLVRTLGWQLIISPNGFASDFLQNIGLIDEPLNFLYTRSAVQLGVVYNYLPLMILPLFVAFDRLDPAMREASKDLGANRFKTFMQVSLPLAMPGVVAGLLLVFIPLMGDYITAEILGGAKGNMLGQLVANWFTSGQNWPVGSATAVVLMSAILLSVLFFGAIGWGIGAVLRARRRVDIQVGGAS